MREEIERMLKSWEAFRGFRKWVEGKGNKAPNNYELDALWGCWSAAWTEFGRQVLELFDGKEEL